MVPDYSRTKDGITFLHPDNNSLISVEPSCAVLFSSKSRRKEAAILKEERERKWGSRKGFWYRAMHWMEQPTTETAEDRSSPCLRLGSGPEQTILKSKIDRYVTVF